MIDKNKAFDKYIELFKKLPLDKKKELVNIEAKKTLAFAELIKSSFTDKEGLLINKELSDLNSDNISEEDFVEAMLVYLNSIKETIAVGFNELCNKEDIK